MFAQDGSLCQLVWTDANCNLYPHRPRSALPAIPATTTNGVTHGWQLSSRFNTAESAPRFPPAPLASPASVWAQEIPLVSPIVRGQVSVTVFFVLPPPVRSAMRTTFSAAGPALFPAPPRPEPTAWPVFLVLYAPHAPADTLWHPITQLAEWSALFGAV